MVSNESQYHLRGMGPRSVMNAPNGEAKIILTPIGPPMSDAQTLLTRIADPLLNASPFRRLERVTFLGILSPKFSHLPDHPLAPRISNGLQVGDDGSRADHSLGVANLMMSISGAFDLSPLATRYAAAWALTHDIATWPLSHTGEVSFASITGTDHRELRRRMIIGDPSLPADLSLTGPLAQTGIDPNELVLMFDKNATVPTLELRKLHSVIHSAITPDTLEGIHRAGHAIGIPVPMPNAVLDAIDAATPDMFIQTVVRRRRSRPVLKFWRAKGVVYDQYINAAASIEFESRWTHAIALEFKSVSLINPSVPMKTRSFSVCLEAASPPSRRSCVTSRPKDISWPKA